MARTHKVRAFGGMSPMIKAGLSAAAGAAAGTYLEPELKKVLPASVQTETGNKVIHFGTIFVAAVGTFWILQKV